MAVVRAIAVELGEVIRGDRPGYGELTSKWGWGVEGRTEGNSFKGLGCEGEERRWSRPGPVSCS